MPSDSLRAPRFFYGWVIVGATFGILAIGYIVWYSFGLFLVALVREFGWARAEAAGAFSVYVLMHAICAPIAGRLVDRFGPRALVHGGGLLAGLGLLGCSQLTALWQLYVCFGVLAAAGVTLMGWVPSVALVGRWFSHRLGLAMGIIGAGIGLGTFIGAPPVQWAIETYGWRTAYLALAVVLAVTPQPLALLLRARPEEMGLMRDGAPPPATSLAARAPTSHRPSSDPRVVDSAWVCTEWTVRRAIRTRRFLLLFLTFGLTSFATQQTHAHHAAYLVGQGYDPLLAAAVVGVVGLASIPGKIFLGTASDWLGRERLFTLGAGAGAVALLLLLSFAGGQSPPSLLFLYAALFALGYSVAAALSPAITADLFYGRHYGAIYGVLMLCNGWGGATGSWLGGFIFDRTGGYQLAWLEAAAALVLTIVCVWLVAPRHVLLTPGQARRQRRGAAVRDGLLSGSAPQAES
ncbi:MAG: MFS transporter [Chloroflexi bacterium]|nr:MFS transporter [Chloroflexota bacterium]